MRTGRQSADSLIPVKRATPFTSCFIAINVAVAVVQLFLGPEGSPNFVRDYLPLVWADFMHGWVWELFTYMWVHADFVGWYSLHIIFNMMTLNVFGSVVEAQLGVRHFLCIYLGGGIMAGLFFLGEVFLRLHTGFASPETLYAPLVGASGAVLALAVAFAFLFPSAKLFIFPIPFPVKAWMAMAGFVAVSVILIFVSIAPEIAHSAHLGGMAFGAAYMLWLRHRMNQSRENYGGEGGMAAGGPPAGWDIKTLRARVDPILMKVSRNGLASLSEEEQEILREAQRRFS